MGLFDISPFKLLKDIRDGEITEIPPRCRATEHPRTIIIRRLLNELKTQGILSENDNGELALDPIVPRLFDALGISLTQLEDYYGEWSIVCNPRFHETRRDHAYPTVFVMMPFSEELRPVYEDHVRKVVEAEKATCLRADDLFGAGTIINDIWSCIRCSDVIIADCTGRNPNVFYEIGIAHTLGKPVILVSQDIGDVPFDLRHERIIIYKFTPKGMKGFENTLRETLLFEL